MSTNGAPDSWPIRIDSILRNHDPNIHNSVIGGDINAIEGDTNATIFLVPTPLREVSKQSYIPQIFSFGLLNQDTRDENSLDSFRHNFAKIFMNITEKRWDEICLDVVGIVVEYLVKFYGDFQLESDPVVYGPTEDGIKALLALDAVFLVCFIQGDHQRVCPESFCPSLKPLNEEMEKAALRPLVHLIRLDIFKFENQIPLCLIQNVVNMIFPETRRTNDPLNEFLEDALDLIYCLPGPLLKGEFRKVLRENLDLKTCNHLLHCLYSAICYNKSRSSVEGNTGSAETHAPTSDSAPVPPARTTVSNQENGAHRNNGGGTVPGAAHPTRDSRSLCKRIIDKVTSRFKEQAVGGQEENSAGDGANVPGQAHPTLTSDSAPVPPARTTASDQENAAQRNNEGGRVPGAAHPKSDSRPLCKLIIDKVTSRFKEQAVGGQEGNSAGDGANVTGQAHPTLPSDSAPVPPARTTASDQENAAQRNNEGGRVPGAAHPARDSRSLCKRIIDKVTSRFKPKRKHNHSLHIPTVTALKEVGIRVSVGSGKLVTNWISEVKFQSRCCSGTLYLPQFSVYDETEILLRNLLVYESVVEKKQELISYVHLMDNLINTEEDVKLMRESKVLVNNSLGSDHLLAEMWNNMLTGHVVGLNEPYLEVFDKIKEHYGNKRNKLFAEFQGLYLRRPWLTGGAILLLLTAVATFLATTYTVLSYYYGNKNRLTT